MEEENAQLRTELASVREELAKALDAMTALVAAQEQPTSSAPETTEAIPTSSLDNRFAMPRGYPYGLPLFFAPDPTAGASSAANSNQILVSGQASLHTTLPQSTVFTDPIVHSTPQGANANDHRGKTPVLETMEERMEELARELRREIKANRGSSDLVNTHDLCLVPRVDVPKKFKVPEFDRYNGLTCPQNHIIKYVRKMANHADNDSLMIHCFQDSLMEDAAEWYTGLSKDDIHTFDDLAAAFKSHYGFNTRLKPNREFLRSLSQKKDESFREYAQRWRGAAARITPALDEEEMTQTFLKTLKKDYVERMIIAAPSNFSEMVTMGTRLEEAVREGIIVFEKGESSNAPKKYGNGHHKKKESEVGMVSAGTNQSATAAPVNATQLPQPYQYLQYAQHPFYPPFYHQYPPLPGQPQVPVNAIAKQMQQQPLAQQQPQQQQQGPQSRPSFPPIPMAYAELLPTLLHKGYCTTRPGKPPPNPLPPRFRSDLRCDFHQGALGHDVEGCYALKYIVKKLIDQGKLSFENNVPHVLDNPLPNHAAVNMIEVCEEIPRLNIRNVATPLVPLHIKLCRAALFSHDHVACCECLQDPMGCSVVQTDIQSLMNDNYQTTSDVCMIVPIFHDTPVKSTPVREDVEPLVIRLPGLVPYTSAKAIPYKYSATMLENGKEVPLVSSSTVGSIAEVTTLRRGKVRPLLFQKKDDAPVAIPADKTTPLTIPPVVESTSRPGQSIEDSNLDEILKIIKKSDYKIVDQLLQTPSKISILSLLLSSEAHRNVLLKVLEQAYVDHEVTEDQFGGIVANITACSNLWFGEDELPEAGKHHNLALHISMNCKTDMMSNVLVDTGSSLNVMPNSTLDQLSCQGVPLRRSTFLVKAFDGSRKTVLGEVDLPMTIGPETFMITFQVMDIDASYSCLLGRPWIHEAGAVTSTLHQKLKFVRNGKLVTVHGEEAYLVSQLSSFSCIEAKSAEGTAFQGLTIEGAEPRRASAAMASLKDAQKAVQEGQAAGWGQLIQLLDNKRKEGLGFSLTSGVSTRTFRSAGFANAILDGGDERGVRPTFVIPGGIAKNWNVINLPVFVHDSK